MNELATQSENPFALTTFESAERMSKAVASSGMFGITKPEQAMCLFAICNAEGIDPISALRRYHLIEGKPSMRADAMLAEFIKSGGGVLWHVRSDEMVAATWFKDASKIDDAARKRGVDRFDRLWKLGFIEKPQERGVILNEMAHLARDGEETILRTYADCELKGITLGKDGQTTKTNWARHPKEMLTARNITEGIRIVSPMLITGIVEEHEARDIAEETRPALRSPQDRDKEAIQAMIDQYLEESRTADPARKSELLGLASDLRLKLEEMSSPATVKVLPDPPEETREPEPAAETEVLPPEPAKWEDYELSQVKSDSYKGRKLGELSAQEIAVLHKSAQKIKPTDAPKKVREAEAISAAFEATTREPGQEG